MSDWGDLPGETPIDVSGLKRKGIRTRAELNQAEAENIRKAVVKYLAAKPSRRSAPFTLSWSRRLHKQMFGDVWKGPVSFGVAPSVSGAVLPRLESPDLSQDVRDGGGASSRGDAAANPISNATR